MPALPHSFHPVIAPRQNAGDAETTIIEVHIANGEPVSQGQLLFVLESTKSVCEVTSSHEGYVRDLNVALDDRVPVGSQLCIITDQPPHAANDTAPGYLATGAGGATDSTDSTDSTGSCRSRAIAAPGVSDSGVKLFAAAPIGSAGLRAPQSDAAHPPETSTTDPRPPSRREDTAGSNASAFPAKLSQASDGTLPERSPEGVLATGPAQSLAQHHAVDIHQLGLDRIVTRRDVQSYLDGLAPVDAPQHSSDPRQLSLLKSESNTTWDSEPGRDAHARPRAAATSSRIVIYGAGSHAAAVIELIRTSRPDMEIIGAIDDATDPPESVLGVPILGDASQFTALREEGIVHACLGIGGVSRTQLQLRKKLFERLVAHGFQMPSFIHPRACVESSVTLGKGNQVFAGAVLGTAVHLADDILVNSGSIISHHSSIGSHSHIAPGAVLAGGVTVGQACIIGMGCTVYLGTTIGDEAVIVNGVHTFQDVPDKMMLRSSHRGRRAISQSHTDSVASVAPSVDRAA